MVVALLIVLPRLLNRGTGTSTKNSQPTATLPVAASQVATLPAATSLPQAVRPEATRAASGGAPAFEETATARLTVPAFAPATPTPTLTPPVAVNLTNNREGKYEKLALLFDQNDTLHLVFASPLLRSAGDYWHQQLSADGIWTQAESLTNGFDILWSDLRLRRNAQGQICA